MPLWIWFVHRGGALLKQEVFMVVLDGLADRRGVKAPYRWENDMVLFHVKKAHETSDSQKDSQWCTLCYFEYRGTIELFVVCNLSARMFSTSCISSCPAWKDIIPDSTFASVKPYAGLENLSSGQSNALCTYFVISVTKSCLTLSNRHAVSWHSICLQNHGSVAWTSKTYIMSQATPPPTHSFALFWHRIVVKMPTKSVG